MGFFHGQGLVKYPVAAVFAANRDSLSLAIAHVDDLEHSVKQRVEHEDGTVELVNTWRAHIPIPAPIRAVVKPAMVVWTDRALWTPDDHSARWVIDAPYFPNRVRCSGTTLYEEAARGQATRVTLRGEIEIDTRDLGMPEVAERALARGIEEFVCALFPVTLRKVIDAVSRHLSEVERPSIR